MISFLYPLLGLVALAAIVPILLHLIRRYEVRRIEFPAIRYLRRAEQRHARRLRLKHLLLLAARVLMILLIATAAAGPLIGRGGAVDHRPTAVAIVLDESLSSDELVGERSLLELFVERAERTVDFATPNDLLALFSAVSPEAGPVSLGIAGTRAYLSSLRTAAAVADLPAALRQASAWLQAAENREREIHLLSDRQLVSVRAAPDAGAAALTGSEPRSAAPIHVVAFSPDLPPRANGAPGTPRPEVTPLSAGQATRLTVPLVWFGGGLDEDPVVVRLVRGETVVDLAEARFQESAVLTLPPQATGWAQGYVEIDNHGLVSDDRRYFTWLVRPAARVASLGDPGPFLRHALGVLELGGRLLLSEPERADVWLSEGAQGIEEASNAGRAVVALPPNDPLDLARTNARLARAGVPWRYLRDDSRGGSARITGDVSVPGVAGIEVRSPYRLVPERVAAADTVLLRLESGEPWLVRGTSRGGAAYLLLATPLTAEALALPVSAAMVPFVDALLAVWSRSGPVEASDFQGGSSYRLPPRARTVRGPDGSILPVEGGAWLALRPAGNYAVYGEEGMLHAFSVNAPPVESNLTQASIEALQEALPLGEWTVARRGQLSDWEGAIYRARRGRLAWRPLVVALILVSIVEASLAAAGKRRNARPRREIRPA